MVNWQLLKQGIRWSISDDHIAGTGVEPNGVMYSFKLAAGQVMVFHRYAGSSFIFLRLKDRTFLETFFDWSWRFISTIETSLQAYL